MNQIISKIKKLVIDFYSEKEKVDLLYSRMNNINYTLRRLQLEDKLLNSTIPGITDKKYCDCDIIVSLTSYGRRLHDVCFAIESIMQQWNHTGEDYILNAGVQNMALSKVNNGAQNLNDKQIKAVFEKYKIYDKLRAEEGIQTQVKHR